MWWMCKGSFGENCNFENDPSLKTQSSGPLENPKVADRLKQ